MDEVLRHSFGETIDYDDMNDPIVRRLRFLRASPSVFIASLYEGFQQNQLRRSAVLQQLSWIDADSNRFVPGSPAWEHEQWLQSIRYDLDTYEILGPREPRAPQIQRIGVQVRGDAERLLKFREPELGREEAAVSDSEPDGRERGVVVRFPGRATKTPSSPPEAV